MGFTFCAERPRFELGDQKYRSQLSRLLHYHSATSPCAPSSRKADREFTENRSVLGKGPCRKLAHTGIQGVVDHAHKLPVLSA